MSDMISSSNGINTETSKDKPDNQPKDSKEEKKAREEAEKLAKEKSKKDAIVAKEMVKREAEEAKKAKKEEKKARKEAEKTAKEKAKEDAVYAKEKAKREAIEAKKAKKEEKKARKEDVEISITTKSEAVKKKTKKTSHKLYKGEVKLLILPPVDSKNLKELEVELRNTKGLKILLIGGTADGGIQIIVSTSKPIPLLNALMETPQVEEAIGKDDTIHVSLK